MIWATVLAALCLSAVALALPGALARSLALAGRARRPRRQASLRPG